MVAWLVDMSEIHHLINCDHPLGNEVYEGESEGKRKSRNVIIRDS